MPLTDRQVKEAKPKVKDYKLYDEKGLFVLVKVNGSKYWRLKYRYFGREKTLALGVYPEVTFKSARLRCHDARTLLANGIDPGKDKQQKKQADKMKASNAFESVAREWHDIKKSEWTDNHAERVIASLEKDIFPHIGSLPISEIQPPELLNVIKRIEKRDALDLAKRLLQRCSGVFEYAVITGKVPFNPARDLSRAIKTRKTVHQPSISREELPKLLKSIDSYDGLIQTKIALRLLIHTFVRPGELRGARWNEFDMDAKEWRIPGERMKMKTEHIVPLTKQSIKLLKELDPITGRFELLFPSERKVTKSMSENTLLFTLYRLGYKGRATPHGFRATASSILNEQNFNTDAIERQLSHIERNKVKGAYTHHAEFMKERKKIMKWWSEYIDDLEHNKIVVAGKFKRK
jgi:integrase